MNTKQIDYCIELSKTLNFSKAAENMFVSQPSFSYQIKMLEEEVGFKIFDRSGKGAVITPAGDQFVLYLTGMRNELINAIEQGQNFNNQYQKNISIGISNRQGLLKLPDAIKIMKKIYPDVLITPKFHESGSIQAFLRNEVDVLFALKEQTKLVPDIEVKSLYDSRIFLICNLHDQLAQKQYITDEDLYGRVLMVGGGSPPLLRRLQQKLIATGKISYFNSPNHDTTLTNVSAELGVCLAPGFLNDFSGQYAWIPFKSEEYFECVLCSHKNDHREELAKFIEILKEMYN